MFNLEIEKLSFYGEVEYFTIGRVRESVHNFSYNFESQNVYCLQGGLGYGGWSLSWIIGGLLKPERGILKLNNKNISIKELNAISWCVGFSGEENKFFKDKKVRSIIESGLAKSGLSKTGKDIHDIFCLTEERLDRSFRSISGEKWRASLAIGYSLGRKIFCFPWFRSKFIFDYEKKWIYQILNYLKNDDCLIIFPTDYNPSESKTFTQSINFC